MTNPSVGAGKLSKYVTGKNSTFIHVIFVIFMLHLSVACKKKDFLFVTKAITFLSFSSNIYIYFNFISIKMIRIRCIVCLMPVSLSTCNYRVVGVKNNYMGSREDRI